MNFITFLELVFLSVLLAIIWEFFSTIFPSWKRMKLERAMRDLTHSMVLLNKDALFTAKIKSGQYLHDVFYKSMLMALCEKPNWKLGMWKLVRYNEETERAMQNFRSEIDALDKRTRGIIDNAMYASGKVIFLCNPFLVFLFSLKLIKSRQEFRASKKPKRFMQDRLIRSAEYYTIYAVEQKALSECYAQ